MIKILIVDDSPMIRKMLTHILKKNGYTIIAANDGGEGLDQFKSGHLEISLVISDMDMPNMTGLEMLKELRNVDKVVPIIILTSNKNISVALEALNHGANEYLLKDGNLTETILLSVNRVLEKKRLVEENRRLLKELSIKNKQMRGFIYNLEGTIEKLTLIGASISSEKNLNKLLEMIVTEARGISNSDGGTLYILANGHLEFKVIQNNSMNIFMGGASGKEISFPPVNLLPSNISAYCAIHKQTVNVPDVYESSKFDFTGPKKFDESTGYKTKSMLVVPMLDRNQNVIGVLQLINSVDPKTDEVIEFPESQVDVANALASQAAISIENARSYEKIEKKKAAFERFVPIEFLRCLGKEEVEDIILGDSSSEEMSILFSDIRSFTNLSEKMTPEENFQFLNDYLKAICPCILNQGGFVDKFIGDAIMALFTGNIEGVGNDAVAAAIDMQEQLAYFNRVRRLKGLVPIIVGTGIHTGPVNLGTIGYEKRMETTVVGDTVNLASRVEGLTKQYGVSLIITSYTFNKLTNPGNYFARELDTVIVKGKEEPVTIYEVSSFKSKTVEEKHKALPRYYEGIALYKRRDWEDALRVFSELNVRPEADRVVGVYINRCRSLIKSPPDESWVGVTKLDEK